MPCLPVAGEDDFRLFARLAPLNGGQFNEAQMAFDWLEYCDGKTISPKLPLYLRLHHKSWTRNEQTKAKVGAASFKSAKDFIQKLNVESSKVVEGSIDSRPLSSGVPDIATPLKNTGDQECRAANIGVVGGTSINIVGAQQPPQKRSRGACGVEAAHVKSALVVCVIVLNGGLSQQWLVSV